MSLVAEVEVRLRPALEHAATRFQGQIFSFPVGRLNQIQGHAIGLELKRDPRGPVCVLFIWGLDQEKVGYFARFWERRPSSLVAPDMGMPSTSSAERIARSGLWMLRSLADSLKEASFRPTTGRPRRSRLRGDHPTAQERSVYEAAILGRLEHWPVCSLALGPVRSALSVSSGPDLKLSYPRLSLEALTAPGRGWITPEHLQLPWSTIELADPVDWLETYRRFPDLAGRLEVSQVGWSPDGSQAVLLMDLRTGVWMHPRWDGSEPAQPDGPWPRSFTELLVMEKGPEGWQLAARLEPHRPEPLWSRLEKARFRLQDELGESAQVLDLAVTLEGEVESCSVSVSGRVYRVSLDGPLLDCHSLTTVHPEPLVVVLQPPMTGEVILEGVQLYLERERSAGVSPP